MANKDKPTSIHKGLQSMQEACKPPKAEKPKAKPKRQRAKKKTAKELKAEAIKNTVDGYDGVLVAEEAWMTKDTIRAFAKRTGIPGQSVANRFARWRIAEGRQPEITREAFADWIEDDYAKIAKMDLDEAVNAFGEGFADMVRKGSNGMRNWRAGANMKKADRLSDRSDDKVVEGQELDAEDPDAKAMLAANAKEKRRRQQKTKKPSKAAKQSGGIHTSDSTLPKPNFNPWESVDNGGEVLPEGISDDIASAMWDGPETKKGKKDKADKDAAEKSAAAKRRSAAKRRKSTP